MSDVPIPDFDKTSFSQEPHSKRVDKPWGWELHWAPDNLPYMGKIEHVNAGCRLSLQIHDKKQETMMLLDGRAKMIWENAAGELVETEMEPGQGYTIEIGQKHRLAAITDCKVVEVSTPEQGITWRLDDDYARPDETEEQRAKERGEV